MRRARRGADGVWCAMRLGHRLLVASLLLLATGACRSADPLATAKAAGRAACERFLDCLLATSPTAVGPLLEAYGAEGSCWDTDDIDAVKLCTDACRAGREEQARLFPDEQACGECTTDEHCADSPDRPYCHVASATCSACGDDSHCEAGVCDPSLRRCVDCHDDSHCDGGLCDPERRSCVGCHDDAHCFDGVCEPEARVCVGCSDDSDCGTALCDRARGVCTGCADDAACEASQTCVDGACVADCEPEARRCHFSADGRIIVHRCDGAAWQNVEVCSADGRSCSDGACTAVPYGPCDRPGEACPAAGERCVLSGTDGVDRHHCEPEAACAGVDDCPSPVPADLENLVTCTDGVCAIQCLFGDQCPPGMRCASGVCGW